MKKSIVMILWALLLVVGLSLSGCQREVPVDEIPVTQPEVPTDEVLDTEPEGTEGSEDKGKEEVQESTTADVTLYLPNEMADGFLTSSMILEDNADAIVAQLVKEGALPEGVHIISFDPEQKILDMSKEFGDAMCSTGTTGEMLYMGSLTRTLMEHYELDSLMIYVEGEVLETGHVTYDEPLVWNPE